MKNVDLIGPALLQHGSEAQRQRFLRPMVNGAELWCQGFSEPGAGSDLAALRTRAERHGDDYVVNGQKVWTSHAEIADWCFLLCRTESEAPKHKGLSLLLVDMKTPGITVRPLRQMTDDAEFYIGKPLPGREVKIGANGEILVKGEMLSTATWQGGQLRHRDEEWLNTGDMAAQDASGEFRFLGRRSDVIVAAS